MKELGSKIPGYMVKPMTLSRRDKIIVLVNFCFGKSGCLYNSNMTYNY